jgi:monoamine oxidase
VYFVGESGYRFRRKFDKQMPLCIITIFTLANRNTTMEDTDILIIGAGAAGLMAARALAKAGKKVTVLEARDRIGGRIHTLENASGQQPLELGAEFIHGDLPLTKSLLDEAGIAYLRADASMWRYEDGEFKENETFVEHWDDFLNELDDLEQDMSINCFLLREFKGEKYRRLRESVRQYVSGYDNADPKKASAFSLRREWQAEDMGAQYRIAGGYGKLTGFLADEIVANHGRLYLNSAVKKIFWQKNQVKVITSIGCTHIAKQLIIALPLGVLQVNAGDSGSISFNPEIVGHAKAINALGFGAVIKILMEFDEAFWTGRQTEELAGKSLSNMGYLFSNEEIPTWWTQAPQHTNILTGWIGGPEAAEKTNDSNAEILRQSLQSLANIFNRDEEQLKQKLLNYHIVNWTADEFARGSYAYDTVGAGEARLVLNEPVENTIFFAGEYLYHGTAMGTVEAALESGLRAAERAMHL